MSKCVLLDGSNVKIIDVDLNKILISDFFKVKGLRELEYHTFGKGYTAWWQNKIEENTSMEITIYAGASHPIFVDSKVLITNEDIIIEKSIDINLDELKKYFRTDGVFWALIRNY